MVGHALLKIDDTVFSSVLLLLREFVLVFVFVFLLVFSWREVKFR